MSKNKPKENITSYDSIIKKSDIIKFLNKFQDDLVAEHKLIFDELKTKSMTAKGIHNLFYDNKTKKHSYTLKTIYRHIEKLEAANLIELHGHRISDRSGIAERIYGRTAIIFYAEDGGEIVDRFWESNRSREFTSDLGLLIQKSLVLNNFDNNLFLDFFEKFNKFEHSLDKQYFQNVEKYPEIEKIFQKYDFHYLDKLRKYTSIFVTFIQNPIFLESLLNAFKTD